MMQEVLLKTLYSKEEEDSFALDLAERLEEDLELLHRGAIENYNYTKEVMKDEMRYQEELLSSMIIDMKVSMDEVYHSVGNIREIEEKYGEFGKPDIEDIGRYLGYMADKKVASLEKENIGCWLEEIEDQYLEIMTALKGGAKLVNTYKVKYEKNKVTDSYEHTLNQAGMFIGEEVNHLLDIGRFYAWK